MSSALGQPGAEFWRSNGRYRAVLRAQSQRARIQRALSVSAPLVLPESYVERVSTVSSEIAKTQHTAFARTGIATGFAFPTTSAPPAVRDDAWRAVGDCARRRPQDLSTLQHSNAHWEDILSPTRSEAPPRRVLRTRRPSARDSTRVASALSRCQRVVDVTRRRCGISQRTQKVTHHQPATRLARRTTSLRAVDIAVDVVEGCRLIVDGSTWWRGTHERNGARMTGASHVAVRETARAPSEKSRDLEGTRQHRDPSTRRRIH